MTRRMGGRAVTRAMALVVLALLCFRADGAPAVIDLGQPRQTIRGFGGATAFQPPGLPASLSEAELDTLFGHGPNQIGFTLLRIRVAADETWRAVELAHARGAKARGAEVVASPWSPPAAMKSNQSNIGGFLLPSSYAAYARYLNDFARWMAAEGASLYAISVQNEPDIRVDYESCDWTPAQMLEFCRHHAGAITATRLMAPESFQFRRNQSDPILNDPLATENIEIIAGHIYGGGLADYPRARERGKEVWMTEHLELATDWPAVLATGKEIHDCLAIANYNAYLWWYLRRYYGPLGEDGVITKRGHVMSQFAKFIRPGYVRVEATTNPAPGVHVSAYQREQLVIVAINLNATPVTQTFSLRAGAVASVESWITSATLSLAPQPPLPLTDGSFTATLPASSITTFTGERLLAPPVILDPPAARTVALGGTAVLDARVEGERCRYQWSRDGVPLPGAEAKVLVLRGVTPAEAGAYTLTVMNAGGQATTTAARLEVVSTPHPGRLINLATRTAVGTGERAPIAGFVTRGTTEHSVLLRGAGPELERSFGLRPVIADPSLELHDQGSGGRLGFNDDWTSSLRDTFAAVNAFPWATGSKDAALQVIVPTGAYTAIVRDEAGGAPTTGIALLEVYSIDGDRRESQLMNLSTRSWVGPGDHAQIGGFVIGGDTAQAVVIRAAGPALNRSFSLNGVLADPVISLHRQPEGALMATNDDWEPALTSAFAAVGAFAWTPESRDAALVTMLDPGAYTVIVRGQDGGTGLALLEIYAIP